MSLIAHSQICARPARRGPLSDVGRLTRGLRSTLYRLINDVGGEIEREPSEGAGENREDRGGELGRKAALTPSIVVMLRP